MKTTTLKSTTSSPMPWHGWILGGILLLFGIASCLDYIMSVAQGETYFRSSGMTNEQIMYYTSFPLWATIGWTVSVWGNFFAAAAMLFRSRKSVGLFVICLIGSLGFIVYSYFFSAGVEAMGVLWSMPIIMALVTTAMIFYCQYLTQKRVLR
ncbi:hypothetical protein GON26_10890 [Flavobacterium sp. GA093]|uniref:Sugar transporter n=1 Tax=Flavobacterium hydrocarbonoxydans TaxID=2683249 RepID=A0A6I4NV25_9FLAO|nr:hypothetical protein [Flavobacterium hydrocarbonoxydans]MWB94874.1 hypothetical protein [Flavobacterium hydrocarbonoxydans]